MDFITRLHLPLDANIIDVGGGESRLADTLLEKGYCNIWVLDISSKAIETTKQRLGEKAAKIHWILSDIEAFQPPVKYDLWHDRAAFHFLTTDDSIDKYISIAEESTETGSHLILGTFSENGPQKCSGLEIKQYSESSMTVRFSVGFEKIKCLTEDHKTPFGTVQNFLFCSFRRK